MYMLSKLGLSTSIDDVDTMESNVVCSSDENLFWASWGTWASSGIMDCLILLLVSGWNLDCGSMTGSKHGGISSGWSMVFSFTFVIFVHDVSLNSALSIMTDSSVLKTVDLGCRLCCVQHWVWVYLIAWGTYDWFCGQWLWGWVHMEGHHLQ